MMISSTRSLRLFAGAKDIQWKKSLCSPTGVTGDVRLRIIIPPGKCMPAHFNCGARNGKALHETGAAANTRGRVEAFGRRVARSGPGGESVVRGRQHRSAVTKVQNARRLVGHTGREPHHVAGEPRIRALAHGSVSRAGRTGS